MLLIIAIVSYSTLIHDCHSVIFISTLTTDGTECTMQRSGTSTSGKRQAAEQQNTKRTWANWRGRHTEKDRVAVI